ncbi:KIF21B [Cordylochernes scorpioides]|uniref:Kinesin-like protein n=1 Tax=Cordylochernes scorpioides TaxID=51811 RepID=A0ABY6JVQ3_9ARAC|nr:KIF21B [Cordylochernes scorpioides]
MLQNRSNLFVKGHILNYNEIRPQLAREVSELCQVCTSVAADQPQVWLGKDKAFTFDHVFDCQTSQELIYQTCVQHLVEGLFAYCLNTEELSFSGHPASGHLSTKDSFHLQNYHFYSSATLRGEKRNFLTHILWVYRCFSGFNATVLAYGQTGSGKTYTMGTGLQAEGIIPRAVRHLFLALEERRSKESVVTIQFIELYNEEIVDLLNPFKDIDEKNSAPIRIHEDSCGQIYATGLTSQMVKTPEEALKCLQSGSLARTTASTAMNCHSSRSHAIFSLLLRYTRETVTMEVVQVEGGELETLTSKFHFVDLAGSERLKRTGATGERAREGISINCGLLALGNVISALADRSRSKTAHVPYRDSKLTRLLQDSLGGNSQTLMIACISPCDRDFMETLNTLRYANRAKNIRNRLVANQDKFSQTVSALRAQIKQLELELLEFKQAENSNLRAKVKALQEALDFANSHNAQLMAERVTLEHGSNGEINGEAISELVQGYLKEIEQLRSKLLEQEKMCSTLHRHHQPKSPVTARIWSKLRKLKCSPSSTLQEGQENGHEEMEENGQAEEEDEESSESGGEEEEELTADLADLACQIAEREGLIEQLEQSRRRLVALQRHYDHQLALLQVRIHDTEQERDAAVMAAQPTRMKKEDGVQ